MMKSDDETLFADGRFKTAREEIDCVWYAEDSARFF